VDNLAPILSMF